MTPASLPTWALGLAVLSATALAGCPHPTRPDGGLASGIDARVELDAYEDDVYVPPGTDADLDARPRDDAFTPPIDAISPDAWVPLGQDAPFPDVPITLPDAHAQDARSFDAPLPRDVPPDAHRDAPSMPCGGGGACPVGTVCASVSAGDPSCRVPCQYRCGTDGRAYVLVEPSGGSCFSPVEAEYVNDWSSCIESSSAPGVGLPTPLGAACPSNFEVHSCTAPGVGSHDYCAPECGTAADCSRLGGLTCDGTRCIFPFFCGLNP